MLSATNRSSPERRGRSVVTPFHPPRFYDPPNSDASAPRFPATAPVHAAAYRPFRRGDEDKVSVWPVLLAVGGLVPVLSPWLREIEQPVRVDLEAGYTEVRLYSALG